MQGSTKSTFNQNPYAGEFSASSNLGKETKGKDFTNLFNSTKLKTLTQIVPLSTIQMIYVARNVKDVIVSSFHFVKNLNRWRGATIPEFVEDFLGNKIVYTNFWAHIVGFYKMRNEPHIFFVTYEEMKRDLAGVLQRLCTFLDRPQLTEDELAKTVNHLSFGNMKGKRKTLSRLKISTAHMYVLAFISTNLKYKIVKVLPLKYEY